MGSAPTKFTYNKTNSFCYNPPCVCQYILFSSRKKIKVGLTEHFQLLKKHLEKVQKIKINEIKIKGQVLKDLTQSFYDWKIRKNQQVQIQLLAQCLNHKPLPLKKQNWYIYQNKCRCGFYQAIKKQSSCSCLNGKFSKTTEHVESKTCGYCAGCTSDGPPGSINLCPQYSTWESKEQKQCGCLSYHQKSDNSEQLIIFRKDQKGFYPDHWIIVKWRQD